MSGLANNRALTSSSYNTSRNSKSVFYGLAWLQATKSAGPEKSPLARSGSATPSRSLILSSAMQYCCWPATTQTRTQYRDKLACNIRGCWVSGETMLLSIWVLFHGRSCGMWWSLGWDDDFQPEGRGFDSRSSRHVGTLGRSFTCSCPCALVWNSDTESVL